MMKTICRLIFVTSVLLLFAAPLEVQAQAQQSDAVLYEGARLIIGDGSTAIENSTFVVEGGRFTRVGRRGEIQAPPGASRVDLSGKTVMPTLVNTHGHLGLLQQDYIDQLNVLAYCGISVTTSMGRDTEVAFHVRADPPPEGAQLLTGGRGMVGPLGMVPATLASGANGRLPEDLREIGMQVGSEQMAR